jgi:pimeloyl-ACP methyl ester carboxylesterase
MANTWSHSNFAQMGGNENPGMCMTMGGQRLLERAARDVFHSDLNACNEFTNGAELAKKIAVETLVIVGNQDKMTAPISALQVAESIPCSRTTRLDPCGHAMLAEQPNAVLDALATIV